VAPEVRAYLFKDVYKGALFGCKNFWEEEN